MIFASVLFCETSLKRSFVNIQPLRNSEIIMLFTNLHVSQSCPSREFLTLKICKNFRIYSSADFRYVKVHISKGLTLCWMLIKIGLLRMVLNVLIVSSFYSRKIQYMYTCLKAK